MSAPILYGFAPSPPCRCVFLTAKCVGVELELKETVPSNGDTRKPDYLEINPQHTIPTLDDSGFILIESRPIMGYLVSAYAKDDSLYPSGAKERAMVDQMMYFDVGTLYHRFGGCYYPVLFRGETALDEEKMEKLQEAVGILETMLDGKEWAAGPTITIADIALVVTMSNIEACGFDLSEYPQVLAWYDRTKIALAPYGYEEINQSCAGKFGVWLRNNLK